jgi:hypothetical protein
MGACTSKAKKNKEKHLKNDVTNGGTNHNKKSSIADDTQERLSSSINVDKFANVPFIDSEEKLTTTAASSAPPLSSPSSSSSPTAEATTPTGNDNDERTTVKTNFETNVSYSNAETIDKLKQEVYSHLREKILPINDEKEKLRDYVHKRLLGNNTADTAIMNECLEQCFHDVEQGQHPDKDNHNGGIKKRLMNIVTVYIASQSSDNSFLKALYDKMGPTLDLNSLNAETNEHEVVNITVTKTVRQVFLDGSSTILPNSHSTSTTDTPNSVIHIANNECNIPADLPDDIRLKAEQVLNSFNDVLHTKQN